MGIQETERLVADPAPGISAAPHEDNLRYFDVTIQGPDGSPFQSASVPSTDKLQPGLIQAYTCGCVIKHEFLTNRRSVSLGIVPPGGVPNEPAEGTILDKDLSS